MSQKGNAMELGTQPVGKLLMQYAIPAIIAMTASSLYNIVDSIFIGQGVGPLAISGLAVTFPFMNLGAAFGAMVGVGASTLISVKLGQRDYSTAQVVLGNVVTLNTIIGVVYTIVCLMFLDPILYFFGASADTIVYARDFMEVILLGNIFTHMYLGLNAVLRASGHPQKAMYATINTVIINTILAPIFIYGFEWGIRGAAIATVIAQIVSLIWQFKILTDKNELLHLRRGIYHLQGKIVKNMIAIGLSPFCMNVASCFIVIFINQGLKEYDGDLAIGAYGIVNRLMFICVMIVMGITQGMQPIAGYNYGAQQYHRVNEVLKLAIWVGNPTFMSRNSVTQTIHCAGVDGVEEGFQSRILGEFKGKNIREEYNTYGLMWTEDEYIFYINGVETARSTFGNGVSEVLEDVIVSLEIPDENKLAELDKEGYHTEFIVDYVKIYQIAE